MAPLTLARFYLNDGPRWLINERLTKEYRDTKSREIEHRHLKRRYHL